jgi:hypothetical protein
VSSEDEVIEDDRDRAGVDVGGLLTLARASACETATRYDEAVAMRDGFDFFLNIDGVGDDLVNAMGEGIVLDVVLNDDLGLVRVVVVKVFKKY